MGDVISFADYKALQSYMRVAEKAHDDVFEGAEFGTAWSINGPDERRWLNKSGELYEALVEDNQDVLTAFFTPELLK